MDFCYFFGCDVLIINSPLCVFLLKSGHLISQIVSERNLLLFQSRNDIIKPPHLRLNHSVHISDMFQGRLF